MMAAELRPITTAQSLPTALHLQHQRRCSHGVAGRLFYLQQSLSGGRQQRNCRSTQCAAGNGQHAEPQGDNQLHNGTSGNSRGSHRDRHDALPLSLYHSYSDLPCDGKTRSEQDEACDPNTRDCQTPMHVWETNCKKCSGTGTVASYAHGARGRGGRGARRLLYTCPTCHGVGCVRHTSTRILPDVNGGNGQYTAGRPPCEISWEDDGGTKKSLFERLQEKLGS